jgi:hypothetical protein
LKAAAGFQIGLSVWSVLVCDWKTGKWGQAILSLNLNSFDLNTALEILTGYRKSQKVKA